MNNPAWKPPQYQAWAGSGKTVEIQRERLNATPEEYREQVRLHLITVYKIKRRNEMKRKRLDDM